MEHIPSRYARIEHERRFLLPAVPAGIGRPREIIDRYLPGTGLRLRCVRSDDAVVLKLGHKVRLDDADPSRVHHTTMYLSTEEYDLLRRLDGHELRKTRYHVDGWPAVAVDVFHDQLDGLVMAEFDAGAYSAAHRPLPPWCAIDVSLDQRFAGGTLSRTDRRTLAAVIAEVGGFAIGNDDRE